MNLQCDLLKAFPLRIYVASPRRTLNQNGGFANDRSCIDAPSQQWHVDLERQLGTNMKVSVASVGSKSDRHDWTGNANAAQFPSPLPNLPVQTSPQGVSSCGPKGSATSYLDESLSYGPCAFDVPHDVTLSADYELPFGHGKRYLTHGPLA